MLRYCPSTGDSPTDERVPATDAYFSTLRLQSDVQSDHQSDRQSILRKPARPDTIVLSQVKCAGRDLSGCLHSLQLVSYLRFYAQEAWNILAFGVPPLPEARVRCFLYPRDSGFCRAPPSDPLRNPQPGFFSRLEGGALQKTLSPARRKHRT